MKRRNLKVSNTITTALAKADVINFATQKISEIMNVLGVSDNNWAIGGSVAGMLYGIDFGRVPHDIDIIVPAGFIDVMKIKVQYSSLVVATHATSSIDDEWGTNHFAFRTIKGFTIDIIEDSKFFESDSIECVILGHNIKIMSLETLINTKTNYNRVKDTEDLRLLQDKYNELFPSYKDSENNIATE